jgi:hypothetical protein
METKLFLEPWLTSKIKQNVINRKKVTIDDERSTGWFGISLLGHSFFY